MNDFDYLKPGEVYLDSACQSLRPRPVIEALNRYYTEHNSCGERVKYAWGRKTDELVDEARTQTLKFLKLHPREYFVSFTLNTTYGINLILQQLKTGAFEKIIVSDIDHNSPFLASISFAKKHGIPREVITRNRDGSFPLDACDFSKALVLTNAISNIDGRKLANIKELIKAVHAKGGAVIVDAAQAFGHDAELLHRCEADAICASAHKMYGPSLGVMVVRRDFIPKIEASFIGGGMVDDVEKDDFTLSAHSPNHANTLFESGLQAWGEIVAYGEALKWLKKVDKKQKKAFAENYTRLYDFLADQSKVQLVNQAPSPTMSFHIEGIDSHLAGEALSLSGIMARTGYFCVHYYLDQVMHYPPLIRFSLGYHIRPADIDQTISTLKKLIK